MKRKLAKVADVARALGWFAKRAAMPYAQWQAARAAGASTPWVVGLTCMAWVGLCVWSLVWVEKKMSLELARWFGVINVDYLVWLGALATWMIGLAMLVVWAVALRLATPMARSMTERGERAKERFSVSMEARVLETFIKDVDGPRVGGRPRRL